MILLSCHCQGLLDRPGASATRCGTGCALNLAAASTDLCPTPTHSIYRWQNQRASSLRHERLRWSRRGAWVRKLEPGFPYKMLWHLVFQRPTAHWQPRACIQSGIGVSRMDMVKIQEVLDSFKSNGGERWGGVLPNICPLHLETSGQVQ